MENRVITQMEADRLTQHTLSVEVMVTGGEWREVGTACSEELASDMACLLSRQGFVSRFSSAG
jgi:hypothetical protein